MTGVVLGSVRDYAQNHPVSLAAGLIVVLPGTYLYISGQFIPCGLAGFCDNSHSTLRSAATAIPKGLSIYDSSHPLDVRLSLPVSRWSDKPAPTFIFHVIEGTRNNIANFLMATGMRMGLNVDEISRILRDRWTDDFPSSRFVSVAVTTALPGAFLVFIRNHPESWAARHETEVANALHVFALVTVANRQVSIQDLLVAALVMVLFEAFRRLSAGRRLVDAGGSAIETLLSPTHTAVAKTDLTASAKNKSRRDILRGPEFADSELMSAKEKKEEIQHLRRTLVEIKTADAVKEIELRKTRDDLKNARETLSETFAEYSSLRDEMKSIKQTIGRDHQAVVYRKDIELFALRKANEQKETYIKEKETKLEVIYRQHKAALDAKDSQIRRFRERIAVLERNDSPQTTGEANFPVGGDHQAAVQVKILRVKGKGSQDEERPGDKDQEIAKLKAELSAAKSSSDTLTRAQEELTRAWETMNSMQDTLNGEREQHAQTRDKLQETAIRLDEECRKNSQKLSPARLPTIEESDKQELEAMFDAAQQDNLRLYAEHEALDKRLREANVRVFTSEQELAAMREQLKLEKAVNDDMENARPSVVHRVHFQRMEGQLKESREALEAKDTEIDHLHEQLSTQTAELEAALKATKAEHHAQTKLQSEIERLQVSVSELTLTKQQLMMDHERLAHHRARPRNTSAEHTSARSSGATLITDPSIHLVTSADIPLPARPVNISPDRSIQGTPEHMLRSPASQTRADRNRLSLISADIPPSELRNATHTRRKSYGLKNLMRKLAQGRDKENEDPISTRSKDKGKNKGKAPVAPSPVKTALLPKDKNAPLSTISKRPRTAGAALAEGELKRTKSPYDTNPLRKSISIPQRPATAIAAATASLTAPVRPEIGETSSPRAGKLGRYYAGEYSGLGGGAVVGDNELTASGGNGEGKEGERRPKTALEEKEEREYGSQEKIDRAKEKEEKGRPRSRGWSLGIGGRKEGREGNTNKLVRRSA
ncbi:hypothetical protein B0J11DRAFT_582993 [Dendryphion nanum]|uniref:Uncharacterized protein n=1 Tax=Dendryphion nanum TaxID=256645 RepID=A0A9P9DEC5_9PLEO|nr:hypothetical protein B0J11DRAFT_582993 [Dendryphion nanum]